MVEIFTIGDSLTTGYPGNDPRGKTNPESTFQYWLEKGLNENLKLKNSKVYNYGYPGISSNEIYTRLKNFSKGDEYKHSTLVIINGGGNDWQDYARIDDKPLIKNLTNCCELALEDNKKAILTSLTPFGDYVVMEQIEEIAGKLEGYVKHKNNNNLLFFDWFHAIYDPQIKRVKREFDSGDSEHLNIEGYRIIGEKLASIITKNNFH